MTTSPLETALTTAFTKAGVQVSNTIALQKCVKIATELGLKANQMISCWEAYRINHEVELKVLDESTVETLRTSWVKESDRTTTATSGGAVTPAASIKRSHSTMTAAAAAAAIVTPPQHRYQQRQGAGRVTETFGTAPPHQQRQQQQQQQCTIEPLQTVQPYRTGFTPLTDRARQLDNWLVERTTHDYYSTPELSLHTIGVPCQETITCTGRICNAAHEGRLHKTTVLLEGPRQEAGGARIPVDLQLLSHDYSLFSGQVVQMTGMNTGGRKLTAQSIVEGVPPPVVTSAVDEFGGSLRIVTAAGPYTVRDNLEFAPLVDLLQAVVAKEAPDVVVLMGPFIDTTHHAGLAAGEAVLLDEETGEDICVPYDTFFEQKIVLLLEEFCAEHEQTQFVLVPSLDDGVAENVYPQPPLQDQAGVSCDINGGEGIMMGTLGLVDLDQRLGSSNRVHCVSNPALFKMNEVIVGVTSTDVVFHLSTDETNDKLPPGSRMARIAEHLVKQRSFYPLFPPYKHVNLDLKQMDQWTMPVRPDLLLLPSKLKEFAKPLLDNTTLAVNPGRLTRDTTGGTYAVVGIGALDEETLKKAAEADEELPHGVPGRAHVEIRRI